MAAKKGKKPRKAERLGKAERKREQVPGKQDHTS